MPQYRIEISPNNRAGCKDAVCSKDKVKILKGEIRFGTWVEIQDHGSWAWKHWGCVSGSQLQNLRDECDKGDDGWDFDAIDGYDELGDPKVREKVQRCVRQAHVDAEDFKGDPEKNLPGEKGIRLTAKQRAAKEAAEEDESDGAKPTKKKKTAAKRARKSGDGDGDADSEEDDRKAKKTKAAAKAPPKPAASKARGKGAPVKDEDETEEEEAEEAEEEAAPKASKKTAKARAGPDAKGSSKPGRRPAKKMVAEEESADEKPAGKRQGRRTGRSSRGRA
ncbi:uncharacterized protein UV8b_02219 [Ustilaginoidea virens]|uniref:PARP-type domain-containing protein n=1 Tax=Ustilaginoidea virens TaxID=1159556 RepID=A0A8E5HMF2_USTVR|nr:uncharacterized protein UV8b_02219 [Ustilaginoidea virens]QUC17978.1 hypothetical protein UV8b_02219 [Ustilaginoidea virens]